MKLDSCLNQSIIVEKKVRKHGWRYKIFPPQFWTIEEEERHVNLGNQGNMLDLNLKNPLPTNINTFPKYCV